MRIRIKFTKTGTMKYIGHLDVMRFFQKVLRRAGIPVAFSEGFSPHMLMSFAQPLGVGVTSEGEYFDLDLRQEFFDAACGREKGMEKQIRIRSRDIMDRMNAEMPEGFSVTCVVKIPEDKASKCMTLVAAADYEICFDGIRERKAELEAFFAHREIPVLKKTKRSEAVVDIRPLIYEADISETSLFLRLSSGSVNNLKPRLVMDTFFEECGKAAGSSSGKAAGPSSCAALKIHRKELYAHTEDGFIPLYRLGQEIV